MKLIRIPFLLFEDCNLLLKLKVYIKSLALNICFLRYQTINNFIN